MIDEREIWVFEDDVMGCSECYEDRLDDRAILPPHMQPHMQMSAGICGMCGYVLDPSIGGLANEIAERMLDAAAVARYISLSDGESALCNERPQRVDEGFTFAPLSDDLRAAAQSVREMGRLLADADVDRKALNL